MEKVIQYHIEEFTGPLDLLLALIAKNKMSIYDIEIHTLIDQYLEVVNSAERQASEDEALEALSEFIAMAARLVQMKSQLLLPRSDEGERMREELTGLLVEYSACKEVAARLAEMAGDVFLAVRAPLAIELDSTYKGSHAPAELAAAIERMGGRRHSRRVPQREQFDDIVAAPFVSVAGRVIHVLRGLVTGKVNAMRQLFAGSRSRSETVATFLALLELMRGGRVSVDDEGALVLTEAGKAREARRARRKPL